jgi:hypothetical protein
LGRARRDRRQHPQHRPCHGKAGCTVGTCLPLSIKLFNTPLAISGGSCLVRIVSRNPENTNFALESS